MGRVQHNTAMISPEPQSGSDPQAATIDYEQPLSERLRTYLRLEFLYRQTQYHQQHTGSWATRAAMSSMLEILAITARGDCRTDALKELERQLAVLNEFRAKQGVDGDRLHDIMAQLAHHRGELNSIGGMFMQNLRDSEFLSAIRHRSAIPGGTCEFDLRDYFHWLNEPFEVRQQAFDEWMGHIRILCEAVIYLLWVTRQNSRPRRETAVAGNFQLNLDRDSHCQLLRITLPAGTEWFPEISGSHYRCSIRFLKWQGVNTRPIQVEHDVPFLLTTCS
ncbi:MAG: cell division protein ZapD [Steroidobacteraceae bacterium]